MTTDDDARERALRGIDALLVAISVRSLPRLVGSLIDANVTVKQLKVLSSLTGSGTRTLTELAAEFEVSLATMSGIVDKLVHGGLVERTIDADDQRSRKLQLSALGRSVVGQIIAPDPRLGDEVAAGLDQRELDALEVGLTAVSRELRRIAG